MKTGRLLSLTLTSLALVLAAPEVLGASGEVTPRAAVIPLRRAAGTRDAGTAIAGRVRPNAAAASVCLGLCYSVELPQISRVLGRAFYRTAVDISNNTRVNGVIARFQYTYTCLVPCTASGAPPFRTNVATITLRSFDSFHSDDFVDYMNSLGLLASGANDGSYGTLLVTFDNLPSTIGWEGTVVARNYNRLVETDPTQGTIGYAYPASLFFESAHQSLVATLRDTTPAAAAAASTQGSQRTNLGVRNTDINGALYPSNADRHASVKITFVDVTPGSPTNGQQVGNTLQLSNIVPGEVRQFSNIFSASNANIPSNVTSVIAFVDVLGDSAPNVTIEGYVNVVDNVTQDGSFFEMKCADTAIPSTCGQ